MAAILILVSVVDEADGSSFVLDDVELEACVASPVVISVFVDAVDEESSSWVDVSPPVLVLMMIFVDAPPLVLNGAESWLV